MAQSNSTKTDAAGRAGSTNAGPPVYSHGKPPTIPANAHPAVKAGSHAPTGDRVPRDMRKNSGGN